MSNIREDEVKYELINPLTPKEKIAMGAGNYKIEYLTKEEIIERYSDILSEKDLETLKY